MSSPSWIIKSIKLTWFWTWGIRRHYLLFVSVPLSFFKKILLRAFKFLSHLSTVLKGGHCVIGTSNALIILLIYLLKNPILSTET